MRLSPLSFLVLGAAAAALASGVAVESSDGAEVTAAAGVVEEAWEEAASLNGGGGGDEDRQEKRSKRPNIVVLFADNLAYDDVGAFAASHHRPSGDDSSALPGEASPSSSSATSATPRLDELAADSLLFRQWTSPAVLCSASRAALLTGRYPVRSGVYPRVFEPDAALGLPPDEITLAEHLGSKGGAGYATKIVGKWHLGHAPGYRPTDRGFDSWFGIPYHMSGGSVDGHACYNDVNGTRWLPLFDDDDITQQPVDLTDLAERYASSAEEFVEENARSEKPFFLYLPFSHVHQLCAPRHDECQWSGPPFSHDPPDPVTPYHSDFKGSVREMDRIAGRVLDSLRSNGVYDDTLVVFTSDNGPWVAEGPGCAGSKGPFEGTWLRENVEQGCTACPSGFVHEGTPDRPRRCVYHPPPAPGVEGLQSDGDAEEVDGIHCGEDSGLGSAWEANVRVPALVRWPSTMSGGDTNAVPRGTTSDELVSTLDVVPTVLAMLGMDIPDDVDGIDVSDVWRGRGNGNGRSGISHALSDSAGAADPTPGASSEEDRQQEREHPPIFYWRDGFASGPLPSPYGRFDVVAVRLDRRLKAWFYTKSAHYNPDVEVYHDPPLLFDVLADPAESIPLDPVRYAAEAARAKELVKDHEAGVDWRGPLTLQRDPKFLPCADREAGCRTGTAGGGPAVASEAQAVA